MASPSVAEAVTELAKTFGGQLIQPTDLGSQIAGLPAGDSSDSQLLATEKVMSARLVSTHIGGNRRSTRRSWRANPTPRCGRRVPVFRRSPIVISRPRR